MHEITPNGFISFLLATAVLAGCAKGNDSADSTAVVDTAAVAAATSRQCPSDVRDRVQRLGTQMRRVSLLAPDSIVARDMADAYGSLVTPALLASWQKNPSHAPGRQVSNPWPARIEVKSVDSQGAECRVTADVVYVLTSDTLSAVDRRPVTLTLRDQNGWRVSAYGEGAARSAADTPAEESPADVVRRYYQAIAAKNYDDAYALWSNRGKASGQSAREFARGFAQTARVHVTVTDSVRLEGAAGSQYATVPVFVDAVQNDDRTQHFSGTYTLRRSMVDGATAEQRQWRIESADLQPQAVRIGK